ncbi:MAG TPA: class A beta-lactamase [Longimicrobium sp.]|nr:class A beta-lactamase [Longimicrobium sp.]
MLTAAASLLLAAAAQDTSTAALRRELARIAAESGGHVGIAAIHVETGQTVQLNGAEGFPMQSVFKLPLGLLVLRRAEAGALRLDAPVAVTAADLRPGHSPIADRHPNGGARYTVRELLRFAVSESDNTAADLLLRQVGGPAAVTRDLRQKGIRGVRVDRGEGDLALDVRGVPRAPGREARAVADSLGDRVPRDVRARAFAAYLRDPRDTATPLETARLLVLVQQGEALGPRGTAELLRMMTRTSNPARLKARLPAGTPVAHKTGTSGEFEGVTGVVDDVGLVTLPDGTHLAVAVFVREARRGTVPAERGIARIGRAVYDHWAARHPARR